MFEYFVKYLVKYEEIKFTLNGMDKKYIHKL